MNELDQEIHYFFWAKIEWEVFITTWPPYIDAKEISRIISEYHINRTPEQRLPERIDVNVTKWYKIDVYNQLQANWNVLLIICGRRVRNEKCSNTYLERI